MKPGDILRQRKIRTYFTGKETRGCVEFVADQERIKANQKVFVSLLLGMEPLSGESELDVERVLNRMGWWSDRQFIEVFGLKETRRLLHKADTYARLKREKNDVRRRSKAEQDHSAGDA